eukprot:CAMPEP_0202961134 /NCGR_PEP_ID=MMETSP1396-20130829/5204_1 /ASSEMBLY_ACC=CAM_ASM_000872 /TAXON_ID= /ORGANISM="Pseudokeronopsis sp., Strain Brazil" /LENGTH=66 /DNA_ID=CAMNT_0049680745 /DNA_START=270 /DNA_END=470 /DNA_ORIENTATION=-
MKTEEALQERCSTGAKNNHLGSEAFINSSRGGHGASHYELMGESERSSTSSAAFREGPPKIYEELI